MRETLFWLAQPGLHEDIEQGRRELASGRTLGESAGRCATPSSACTALAAGTTA